MTFHEHTHINKTQPWETTKWGRAQTSYSMNLRESSRSMSSRRGGLSMVASARQRRVSRPGKRLYRSYVLHTTSTTTTVSCYCLHKCHGTYHLYRIWMGQHSFCCGIFNVHRSAAQRILPTPTLPIYFFGGVLGGGGSLPYGLGAEPIMWQRRQVTVLTGTENHVLSFQPAL